MRRNNRAIQLRKKIHKAVNQVIEWDKMNSGVWRRYYGQSSWPPTERRRQNYEVTRTRTYTLLDGSEYQDTYTFRPSKTVEIPITEYVSKLFRRELSMRYRHRSRLAYLDWNVFRDLKNPGISDSYDTDEFLDYMSYSFDDCLYTVWELYDNSVS